MQLVRNLYIDDTRERHGYKRKIREAKLAEELENEHTKDWILDKYLNTVPYGTVGGQTAIGVERRRAHLLQQAPSRSSTLREAALLAGLPQAPSAVLAGARARAAPRRAATRCCGKMAELRMITPGRPRRRRWRAALGVDTSTLLHAAAASATSSTTSRTS